MEKRFNNTEIAIEDIENANFTELLDNSTDHIGRIQQIVNSLSK